MKVNNFWKCISILLKNYHTVNRKIFACKTEKVNRVLSGIAKINSAYSEIKYDNGILNVANLPPDLEICEASEDEVLDTLVSCDYEDVCEGFIISLKFLTKNDEDTVEAVGIIDFRKNEYTCTMLSKTFDDFRVALIAGELVTTTLTNRRQDVEPNRWVDFVLKPKLLKWSNSEEKTENAFTSLRLIDIELYNTLYKKLKAKYSKELFDIWEESTDPFKFVYEDLAIAAYLICLWKVHHCLPTAFADLGCGNGLLVYILNQEGYQGYGYDVRSRKIWSSFPKKVILFEETIKPNEFKLPRDVDWIIGNHSDELSPWIPVISGLASSKMKYFLLPCCPFEFSGSKFQRRNSKLSSYNDFLNYVEEISKKCGYITLRDRLKIPSTKRIALIGIDRSYAEYSQPRINSAIHELVASEMQENPMKLRERHEAVRNCTQIDGGILDELVKKIFFFLLGNWKENDDKWSQGTKRSMKEIAQHLSQEDLKSIKSECGGIKTLLKNKHEVFEFSSADTIKIRHPAPRDVTDTRPLTTKKRLCFFAQHHPSGCPLTDADCTFIHA